MWDVLQHYIDKIKVTVWVHGAEIQPWHRREYNYGNDIQRNAAILESDVRMEFWQGLLSNISKNLKFVFVSKYFSEEVMHDQKIKIQKNHFEIIHNPIDTELFSVVSKDVSQRKKILSIRPFASRQYANDLSVQAIIALSKEPWFKELEFRIIGDGKLFDETLAPLRDFENVIIEQRFLKQSEIAQLHKEYGIFLCPTRWDSHGVSRDEAMSSGLIPVTNAVAAIPEFVDERCGFAVPGEDWQGLADAIARMYDSPELFSSMSIAASQRVRKQSNKKFIIDQEMVIFNH
jgi:glycosyltransferase involved in cell wall biosynthesis